MRAKLVVIKGNEEGAIFHVEDGRSVTLGRSTKSSVRLTDGGVSRLHCQVENRDGICRIVDLKSSIGTFVNMKRVTETELNDRDTVNIGEVVLLFRDDSAVAAVPAEDPGPAGDGGDDEMMGAFDKFVDEPTIDDFGAEGAAAEPEPETLEDGGPSKSGGVYGFVGPAPEPEAGELDLVGKDMAGFDVTEKIETGASCTVYKAVQLSMDRTVALKVLAADPSTERAACDRFIATARLAGRVTSPHLAQVYDVGIAERVCFAAIEYVDGPSLSALLEEVGEQERLGTDRVLTLAAQIARGLQAVHGADLVHRQVWPENVLVSGRNTAKLINVGGPECTLSDEEVAAHYSYMASEQIAQWDRADFRSDLYSLGALLFTMLAGRPPFVRETPEETARAVMHERVESLKQYDAAIPDLVCQIVEKAMAKEPGDRYQSANEMIGDIHAIRS